MRSLKDIWQFAFSQKVILPPKPDDLAIAFSAALMTSGKYESAEAAIVAAWYAVPHFYTGRIDYQQHIAPMFFQTLSESPMEGADDDLQWSVMPMNSDAMNDYV